MNDRFAALYPAHLQTVKERHDKALAEAGFDHIIIFGGEIHIQFLDDSFYPFKVNPHFKAWVPIVDNPHCFIVYTPGKTPLLVYYQPVDYWYKRRRAAGILDRSFRCARHRHFGGGQRILSDDGTHSLRR